MYYYIIILRLFQFTFYDISFKFNISQKTLNQKIHHKGSTP